MKKIFFCFPYKGVGGVSLLFSRFATYLQASGYDVAVIDYSDGYMAKNLADGIELFEYSDQKPLKIPADSCLVLQSMTPWSIYPNLVINDRTLLYFITTIPMNLYPLLPFFRSTIAEAKFLAKAVWSSILFSEYRKMQLFLVLTNQRAAISFLDYDIVRNIEKTFQVKINLPAIIPLFSEQKYENSYINNCCVKKENKLIFAWVGRLDDFKIHILNKLIQDTGRTAKILNQDIEIIIVGSGDCANQLIINNLENMTVKRIEDILPKNLDGFLLGIDVLFAMGTSALEGAKLGVPTIRLDYSFKPIKKNYHYKWLYEIEDLSMAQQMNTIFFVDKGHELEVIVASLKSSSALLSQKTFEHYQRYHSIKVAANSLIDRLNGTQLTYHDMKKNFLLRSLLYSLWKKIRG